MDKVRQRAVEVRAAEAEAGGASAGVEAGAEAGEGAGVSGGGGGEGGECEMVFRERQRFCRTCSAPSYQVNGGVQCVYATHAHVCRHSTDHPAPVPTDALSVRASL